MMGAAVLFATLCHRCGLDPQYAHTMATNVLEANDEGNVTVNNSLQSLRDFADIRIMGRDASFF